MAALVGNIGSTQTKTTGTTTVITVPAGGVAAHDTIVVTFVAGVAASSVTDSAGNVYTLDQTASNGTAAKVLIATCIDCLALTNGQSITVNHTSAAARAASADEFSGVRAQGVLDVVAAATGSSTTPNSGNTATTAEPSELLIGVVGINRPGTDTVTLDSPWQALTTLGTTGSTDTSNRTLAGMYRLVTSTGAYAAGATDSSITTEGWAAAIATYKLHFLQTMAAGVSFTGAGPTRAISKVLGAVPSPSVVQSVPFTEVTASQNPQLTGVTTAAGHLIQVKISIRASATTVLSVTDDAGNNYVRLGRVASNSTAALEVWATNAASPGALTAGAITVNFNASVPCSFRVDEIKDANNTNPLEVWVGAGSSTTGTAAASGTSGALSAVGLLGMAAVVNNYGSTPRTYAGETLTPQGALTTSWPSATTGDNSSTTGSNGMSLHSAAAVLTSTSGQAYSVTLSIANNWAAAFWAIRPATSQTLGFAGAVSRATGHGQTAGLSFIGALPGRAISKGMSAALSFVGNRSSSTAKLLAGAALSFAGSVAKVTSKGLQPASLAFTGAVSRGAGKVLPGGLSFIGAGPARAVSRGLIAALTFIGAIPSRQVTKGLSGALSFVGVGPVRVVGKGLAAGVSFTGNLRRSAAKLLAGAALSFAGSTTGSKFLLRSLTGALSFTGSGPARQFGRALAGVVAFSVSQSRLISKCLVGGLSFVGVQARSTTRRLAGSLTLVGGIGKAAVRQVAATLGLSGILQHQTPGNPVSGPTRLLGQAANILGGLLGRNRPGGGSNNLRGS